MSSQIKTRTSLETTANNQDKFKKSRNIFRTQKNSGTAISP